MNGEDKNKLEFNACLGLDAVIVGMFYFSHLCYQVGGLNELFRGSSSCHNNMLRRITCG